MLAELVEIDNELMEGDDEWEKNWYWFREATGFKVDLRLGVGEPNKTDWLVGLIKGLGRSVVEREPEDSPKADEAVRAV